MRLKRIHRGEAASSNGLETIGIYAAGVVAANFARIPTETLNQLTLTYLASRLVYNVSTQREIIFSHFVLFPLVSRVSRQSLLLDI